MKDICMFFCYLLKIILDVIVSIIKGIISKIRAIFKRKKIRENFSSIDYGERKQKRKKSYTRNSILYEQILLRKKEDDPNFDDIAFKEWVKDVFITFQKAWSQKNMMSVRRKVDINLFEQYQLLLNTNNEKDVTNIVDVKQINYIDFSAYSEDSEKEIIELALNVVMYEYDIVESTGNIISGSDKIKHRTTYKLLFLRKNGTQTRTIKKEENCPNCGAPINVLQNKCEYCDAWILNGVRDWVLTGIERY